MAAEQCLFCRIIAGEIPAQVVAESDEWVAFRDIHPVAPVHILIVPRKHVRSIEGLGNEDVEMAGRLMLAAKRIAAAEGVSETGYRLVANSGADAGQVVHHLHFHLIGGRKMGPKLG